MLPVFYKLFNGILTSGIFPNSWLTAVLIPVFKKGDQRDPNNYRGISLASCLAKLFTNIINNRLIEWSKAYDTITMPSSVLGTDCPQSMQYSLCKLLYWDKRLYCTCVDCATAFDTVDRLNLWYKLSVIGIQAKLLSIIQSMSSNIRTCVSVDGFYYMSMTVKWTLLIIIVIL